MVVPTKLAEVFLPGDSPPSIVYLATSKKSRTTVSLTSDAQLVLADLSHTSIVAAVRAHSAESTGLTFSEPSQLIATCCRLGTGGRGNEVSLWDIRDFSGLPLCTFFGNAHVSHIKSCLCVGANSRGTIIAAGTNVGVLVWDVRQPVGLFKHITIHTDDVASLEFHPSVPGTFIAGDEDGNLIMYDLDGVSDDDSVVWLQNDRHPVFQCGFAGSGTIFTLRRTAGLRMSNIVDSAQDQVFDDLRELVDGAFGYPVTAHGIGNIAFVTGGDADGGVAIVECRADGKVKLVAKLVRAHNDCVNATCIDVNEGGQTLLSIGGDGGQLSLWAWDRQ
jgi:WD40 repeat protein